MTSEMRRQAEAIARGLSRRSFLQAAGLTASASLLAACGSSSGSGTSGTSSSASSTGSTSTSSSAATSATDSATAGSMTGSGTMSASGMMTTAGTSGSSMSASGTASQAMKSVAPGTYGDIAVQLSWIKNIEFAGEFFADSKGYYKAAGFSSVNLLPGGAAATSAEALLVSKKALVGLSSPNGTAPAITKQGAPLKIIASTYQKNPFCIVSVKEKTPIASIADMKGKKIGVQSGTNQTIFAGLLKANGLTASDVKIVPVQYDPTVVTTGDVDGFMAYLTNEPILLAGKGFTPVTVGFADNGLPFTAETFTVLQETIDGKRDLLKAFLAAEIMGWKDAVASPSGSADLATNNYGKDQKLDLAEQTKEATAQTDLIVSADTKKNGLFTLTDQLIENSIEALGAIDIQITADKLYDMSLLKELYQEMPSLLA